MKILILGSGGQLGTILARSLHQFELLCLERNDLPLENDTLLKKVFLNVLPNIVINCAAFTNVDLAEKERETADNINHQSLRSLVKYCNKVNATLIHFSTDYVFDGGKKLPYKEKDNPNPINVYGQTKLNGDLHILENAKKFFIFRISWLYSHSHKSFFQTMLINITKQKKFHIVNDQVGRPTSANQLSSFINYLIVNGYYKKDFGLYNFGANGPIISWYDFAKYIFKQAYNFGYITKEPILEKLKTYKQEANRPKYSALSNSKIQKVFDFQIQDWRTSTKNEIKYFYKTRGY